MTKRQVVVADDVDAPGAQLVDGDPEVDRAEDERLGTVLVLRLDQLAKHRSGVQRQGAHRGGLRPR